MAKVVIGGGGIIGLCTAYYLNKDGHDVTVLDAGNMQDGASYGNAGHVVPSHFVPLASPGIVSMGLRWMMDSSSPFYIKPRLNIALMKWGFQFWRSSSEAVMQRHIRPLQQLLSLSRELFDELIPDLNAEVYMERKGILIVYKTEATEKHELHWLQEAEKMGMKGSVLSAEDVQQLETGTKIDVRGGILYEADAHLDPALLMQALIPLLEKRGVKIYRNNPVLAIKTSQRKIQGFDTGEELVEADQFVLANGAWMPALLKKIDISLLLEAGKGYSISYKNQNPQLAYPAILGDHRVVTTPMGPDLRLAGTMEISGLNSAMLPKRVKAIVDSVKLYYPQLELPYPDETSVWSGLRPLSPDGLPYIGPGLPYSNLFIAGGHAMLGLSMATGTGSIISNIISGRQSSIALDAFSPHRFED